LVLGAELQRARHRFGGEIALRSEMAIETAMSETRGAHDRVDADAFEAMLAKKPRRGFHNPFAILRRFLPAQSSPRKSPDNRRFVRHRGRLCRPSGKAWLRPHPGGAKRGAAEIPFNAAQERDGTVKALPADLGDKPALAKIEAILQGDPSIAMLVNHAGTASVAPLLSADVDKMEDMIALNVTALTRFTHTVAPAFVARGAGTIINIASIVAISPEMLNGVYGATKAFVLALSHSLQHELADRAFASRRCCRARLRPTFGKLPVSTTRRYPQRS
jgi:short chain dehydrogenase